MLSTSRQQGQARRKKFAVFARVHLLSTSRHQGQARRKSCSVCQGAPAEHDEEEDSKRRLTALIKDTGCQAVPCHRYYWEYSKSSTTSFQLPPGTALC